MQSYVYNGKVTKVYDGDTITVEIDLGFGLKWENQKLRLYGVDTPEIRGEERPEGIPVRDYVREHYMGKEVIIQTIKDKKGKFGRYLAIIYLKADELGKSLNEDLIEKGYAVEYKP